MAKNLFVDTDNNRLLAGPLTTQIATRPIFYGATAETVTVDLIERDSLQNLLNLAQPSGTTVALRVGVPGNVISVPSLSAISQAGITATATCSLFSTTTALGTASLYSGVTATATASLFGNITALATAVVTRGTACTLSLTVASVRLPIIAFGAVSAGQKIYSSISYSYGGVDALEQSLNPHYQNTNPLPTFSTIDFAYSLYLSDSFDHNTGGPIVVTSPAPSLVVTGSSFDPYDPQGNSPDWLILKSPAWFWEPFQQGLIPSSWVVLLRRILVENCKAPTSPAWARRRRFLPQNKARWNLWTL